jgi:hypothetical protein
VVDEGRGLTISGSLGPLGETRSIEAMRFVGHNSEMPNIASILKAEISRVARKEVRAEIETLKKASVLLSVRHSLQLTMV